VRAIVIAATDSASSPVVVLAVAGALIAALLLAEVISAVLRGAGRRRWLWAHLARRTRMPVRALLVVVGLWVALGLALDGTPAGVDRVASVAAVAAATWLLLVVGPAWADDVLDRHRMDTPGHRHARGSRAQGAVLRAVVRGVVGLAGVATALAVLPETRPAGVAGLALLALVLAVLAGAAVPWLRDVAAGLELAATDALRLDDVVAVDDVWGRVEEITPTSVVVQAWDDRRVVVPARRLTQEAFENWTRRSADLVGGVDLDLDPTVPVADVRAALLRAVEGNDLWDRRVAVLQVVDATGGRVRVRAVVSAPDAPRLADLRCDVREALVDWLARTYPRALASGGASAAAPGGQHAAAGPGVPDAGRPPSPAAPVGPEGVAGPGKAPGETTVLVDPRKDSRLFTGSVFAVERSQAFTGPGRDVLAERDEAGA